MDECYRAVAHLNQRVVADKVRSSLEIFYQNLYESKVSPGQFVPVEEFEEPKTDT